MPRRHQAAAKLGIELPTAAKADPRLWHAVVMSRLGRNPLARRGELATLHRWTEQSVALGEAPLAVVGTAAHHWVKRACELLGTTAVELALADDQVANRCADSRVVCGKGTLMIDTPGRSLSRDALAVMLADRLDVALVRPQGTIHKLLRERLAEDHSSAVRVLVPIQSWGQAETLNSSRVIQELIQAGAIGYCCQWQSASHRPTSVVPTDFRDQVSPGHVSASGLAGNATASSLLTSLIQQPHRWLIHCTRGRQGAWPGQSDQQFQDWVLLTPPQAADLSPLTTLKRIVGQRQLVGTSRTVPGEQAVVCFSASPLLEVVGRRTYRSHLGRWDAEPYGLAIDSAAAMRLGAQRVIYTDPDEKTQTSPGPIWRLQSRGRTFDWSAEREWRLPGTADLRRLCPEEVVVFVDRDDEVYQLAGSAWPVISIQSLRIMSEGVANGHALG